MTDRPPARRRRNTTGFRGVSKSDTKSKPWQARISINGAVRHIGHFPTAEDAAHAYDAAARTAHGAAAILNFPLPSEQGNSQVGPPSLEAGCATIALSRGEVALVDLEDYGRILAIGTWALAMRGVNRYAQAHVRRADGRWTKVYMHRVVARGADVDHANGDGLDNRRSNLRPATRSENLANRRTRGEAESGYKGVERSRSKSNPWAARICVDFERTYLGLFATPEAAAKAYDAAARRGFGEFAVLNFPGPAERSARSDASVAGEG